MLTAIIQIHNTFFAFLDRITDRWFLGLAARLVFAGTLLVYFLNSALTKFDGGPFSIADGAYFQILPPIVEAAGFDVSQISFFPWGLIVLAGTYGEVILPILIVIGLFTRIAALGMIVFVLVQSYVDIVFHGVDGETIGAWFDKVSDAAIMDQRAFWLFVLVYLVLRGAGLISVDTLLSRFWNARSQ